MTLLASHTASFSFTKDMFSDPAMRPHLEKFYESKYSGFRDRIAAMKQAEADGQVPQTLKTSDGRVGVALSAQQYEAAIPSFDKWLSMNEHFSSFDMAAHQERSLDVARRALDSLSTSAHPDLSSKVQTVFSDGDQILGYITDDGGLVTHAGAHDLQKLVARANAMDMNAQERSEFYKEQAQGILSPRYADWQVTDYTQSTIPTRRDFAAAWYPNHDVDAHYEMALEEATKRLEETEKWHRQTMQNLYEMRQFLIESMQDMQTAT